MGRPRFRLAETTADTGLLVWGGTPAELFENAAAGLTRLMVDPSTVRPAEERAVSAAGPDLAGLLVAWLNEWVYLFDAEGFVAREFSVRELGAGRVAGLGRGERLDPGRHRVRALVKGVTYHRLEVREGHGRLRARLVVDL